ncbi:hypothetical protein V5799_008239 [Amblyomma americanum]|uniref:Uncharacterized protein n=1 Tax=Amblyomma americanum TaxID=6943 RepID=A0AAQ4FDV0_AMBAM
MADSSASIEVFALIEPNVVLFILPLEKPSIRILSGVFKYISRTVRRCYEGGDETSGDRCTADNSSGISLNLSPEKRLIASHFTGVMSLALLGVWCL